MKLDRVRPASSIDTEPYWQACREGRLLYQVCDECGETVFHPRVICPYCLSSSLEWRQSSGRGRIYSYSVQHIPLRAEDKGFQPRALGIAALEEGFFLFTEFLTNDVETIRIDMPVRVEFVPQDDGYTLPKFRVEI